MFYALFPLFWNHEILINLNLPIHLAMVGQREKSQKYFDLSIFSENLNDSNSSLGVVNFQKWELFLAHLVVLVEAL